MIALLSLEICIPDHSTLSRRAANLSRADRRRLPDGPIHLLVDSTGLKIFGVGEWRQQKHAIRPRRLSGQKAEAALAVMVLNCMARIGMPISVRIA